jgi:hypothetical protein
MSLLERVKLYIPGRDKSAMQLKRELKVYEDAYESMDRFRQGWNELVYRCRQRKRGVTSS